LLSFRQLPLLNRRRQLRQRQFAQFADVTAAKTNRRRIIPQAAAVASRAIDLANEVLQLDAKTRRQSRRLFNGRIEALELKPKQQPTLDPGLWTLDRQHLKPLLPRAVQNQPAVLGCEALEGHIEWDFRAPAERLQHRPGQRLLQVGPQFERAFGQGQLRIAQQCQRVGPNLRT
jgi:hypothetical protein